jgi:hypothetical protein
MKNSIKNTKKFGLKEAFIYSWTELESLFGEI